MYIKSTMGKKGKAAYFSLSNWADELVQKKNRSMAPGFPILMDPKLSSHIFTVLASTKLAHRLWPFSHSQLLLALSDLELRSYVAGIEGMKVTAKYFRRPLFLITVSPLFGITKPAASCTTMMSGIQFIA